MKHAPPIEQEEDRLPRRPIVIVGIAAILVTLLGVMVATWILARGELGIGPGEVLEGPRVREGPPTVGVVDQTLFNGAAARGRVLGEEEHQLATYGWVDEKRGVARIPIEEAMKILSGGR
jgi:hypothetical protein